MQINLHNKYFRTPFEEKKSEKRLKVSYTNFDSFSFFKFLICLVKKCMKYKCKHRHVYLIYVHLVYITRVITGAFSHGD